MASWNDLYELNDDMYSIELGRKSVVIRQNKQRNSESQNITNSKSPKNSKLSSNPNDGKHNTAVIKVTGWNSSVGKLNAHIKYITRDYQLDVENEEGKIYSNNQESSYQEWINDHKARTDNKKNIRIAASIVVSAPAGTDLEKFKEMAMEFANKNFEGHRYIAAIHDESTDPKKTTTHPHLHFVVEAKSPNTQRLRIDREKLSEWKKNISEISKDYGLNFTSKKKDKSRTIPGENNRYDYHSIKKGIIPQHLEDYYKSAKARIKENRLNPTHNEKKLINKAINNYRERQKQISDLDEMMKLAKNKEQINRILNKKTHLEYINASERMPISRSQMMLKYAISQNRRSKGNESAFILVAPTIKHYLYAEKLAKENNVKLPETANIDVKTLLKFSKELGNKPSKKMIEYANKLANERGYEVQKDEFANKKSLKNFLDKIKDESTLKALSKAIELSTKYQVPMPDKLDKKTISEHINNIVNTPSNKMIDFANSISKTTGVKLEKNLNKKELAKWIDDNKTKHFSNKTYELYKKAKSTIETKVPLSKNKPQISNELKNEAIKVVKNMNIYMSKEETTDPKKMENFIKSYKPTQEPLRLRALYNKVEKTLPDKFIEKIKQKSKEKGREI